MLVRVPLISNKGTWSCEQGCIEELIWTNPLIRAPRGPRKGTFVNSGC